MANSSKSGTPGKKTLNHFEAAEARTSLVKQITASERATLDARTIKLKALRLAREEADRAEAALRPPPVAAKKKSAKSKPQI